VRRVDLVVGAELYYDRGQKWETASFYGGGAGRAVVVAVEPHKETTSSWNTVRRAGPVKSGPGVLVDLYYDTSPDRAIRCVVNVTHLRGPYAETKTRVDESARAAELVARAAVLGVCGQYVPPWRGKPSEVVLSLDVFESVLNRLEEESRG
jgi:hypothetical protein